MLIFILKSPRHRTNYAARCTLPQCLTSSPLVRTSLSLKLTSEGSCGSAIGGQPWLTPSEAISRAAGHSCHRHAYPLPCTPSTCSLGSRLGKGCHGRTQPVSCGLSLVEPDTVDIYPSSRQHSPSLWVHSAVLFIIQSSIPGNSPAKDYIKPLEMGNGDLVSPQGLKITHKHCQGSY